MSRAGANASWKVIVVIGFACLILGVWAAVSEIDQLARAQAQVIASARTQVIQAAVDGVVETISVKEGDQVRKDQLHIQLDRSQAEAAWRDSVSKVAALKAATARLRSEVFGRPLEFPQ